MVYVKFGDNKTKGDILTQLETQQPIYVDLELSKDEIQYLHTVILYDMDAPYPSPYNTMSPYIHWLVYNIRDGDLSKGTTAITYEPPDPPEDSPSHTYKLVIFRQLEPITPMIPEIRNNFPLSRFINKHNLLWISEFQFSVIPSNSSNSNNNPNSFFFKEDSTLTEGEEKFCRCYLKVAAKGKVRNPYAICAKSVGTTSRKCGESFDFEAMPDDLLIAYLKVHKLEVPSPYNRKQALLTVYRSKKNK